MKWRTWLLRSIDGSGAPDAAEPVELAVLPGPSGPMTVVRLQADGFDATGYETSGWQGVGSYRIFVPRGQLQGASELLKILTQ